MLGFDARAARAAWTAIAIAGLLAGVYLLRQVILIFILALMLAYLLTPVVDFVDRLASRRNMSRNLSLLVVYLLLLAAVVSIGTAVGARVADEAIELASKIPQYARDPAQLDSLPIPWWLKQHRESIGAWVLDQFDVHSEELMASLPKALRSLLGAAGSLLFLFLAPILSFFFLKDGAELKAWFFDLISPGTNQPALEGILADVHRLLVLYIRALVALGLCTFATFAVVLGLMGVPYALLLSLLAGAVEFVPAAGPLLAAGVILVVSALAGYPHLVWVAAFLAVYRIFLDYVLQPHFLGQGVALPPLVIIFGVLAGERLAGIPGMLLCIPIMAMARILIVRLRGVPDAAA
ncbi:MAG: AI-2E family transporter [Bryobacteraceae bacterium]